ncbi:hypothetical protein [Parasphingorhabdus halotolerans]|uniref:Uncharacterized protein n=1 Tax=Parasphingorhabdus halotolerans TaxID=2725558 RepID=A0A6H2DPZ0_9SPHN|nr:hypothetical protein [Parasphingorhabdus halotolerans]QJB69736.1 hypothetical protein HF685_10985 [Parasphingorhabdus halotolerans]
MTEAALLVVSSVIFGLIFQRSGLWERTRAIFTTTRGTLGQLRQAHVSDRTKEMAARRSTIDLMRYIAISVPLLIALVALSALPTIAALLLGWTSVGALWSASTDPVLLVVTFFVFLAATRF